MLPLAITSPPPPPSQALVTATLLCLYESDYCRFHIKVRSGSPMVKTLHSQSAEAQIEPLVGKIRSHKLCSAKTEKDKYDMGLGIHCQIQVTLMIS